ncbi:hypothetical protein [Enterococcus sp. DIV0756]|uniref:hypothetical protein n=1 Tax=Enterococcus sp. DIV0756 TaxID=2774636 RepID=UPI003F227654
MKRTKKQVLSLITVGYLLLNTVVMSGAVFAKTVPSEEIKTTTSSSAPKESLSSTMPTIPAPSTSSSEPIVSSEPKEEKRVLTYEDNQLFEAVKADSAIPAVVFQNRELEDGLNIQGTVSAGKEENQSETILSALILQRQAESGEWEDTHHFSIGEKGVNLSVTEFPFEYSEEVEKTGVASYRLAADYTINYSNEDEQPQKGSVEIGKVIKVDAKDSEKQTEESISAFQESSEPEQESTTESNQDSTGTTIEESTVESSGPKVDSKQDEPVMIDPSTGTGTTSPSTLGENNQIPKMADTYREAFQRGLGIMPMASAGVTPTTSNEYYYQAIPFAEFAKPVVISAQYTSKTRVTMKLRINWKYEAYNYYTSVANPEVEIDNSSNSYDFHLSFGGTYWGKNGIVGQLNKSHMVNYLGNGSNGNLDVASFVNSRIISQRVSGSPARYYYWSDNTTTLVLLNIPTLQNVRLEYNMKYKSKNATYYIDYYFGAPNIKDLSHISIPKFTATDEKTTSVDMTQGTYSGDTSNDKNDGVLQLSLNKGASWTNHITNLNHTISRDGTYSARNITGLTAGTEYYARVSLKDWLSASGYSGNGVFYTPNSVNIPQAVSLGVPTNSNNATAQIEATYNVGSSPAHPSIVETQILDTGTGKWVNVSSSPKVNTSTKKINYELKGLTQNSLNYTRYRVKNASGAWSPWAACQFSTKGIDLVISELSVDHDVTGTNQLTIKSGTYSGQPSTDPADKDKGEVWYKTGSGTWSEVTKNLMYSTTLDGIYSGQTIVGLTPGTLYDVRFCLRDSSRIWKYRDSQASTLNTVSKPTIDSLPTPLGKHNASVDISGVYGIGPVGTTPAHPDKVQVQISLDNSTWQNIDSSTTPKIDTQSIDTSSTKTNFTISKLKADTEYFVRYRVENQGGWSAWSESDISDKFKTPKAPASMELINAPKLDFGMLKNENFPQTATLDAASTKNHVEVENSILTKGWKLTAKLDQLKRTDNPSILMPWATLTMKINLQNSTDDGLNWGDYNQGVVGSPGIVTINSGAAAKTLWSISDPNDAQGYFRTEIDWSSVTLDVPANQTGMYAGNLVWSLDDTP